MSNEQCVADSWRLIADGYRPSSVVYRPTPRPPSSSARRLSAVAVADTSWLLAALVRMLSAIWCMLWATCSLAVPCCWVASEIACARSLTCCTISLIAVCAAQPSLSAAGRILFARSREGRTSRNDADRLRKYLLRFGLSFDDIRSAAGT